MRLVSRREQIGGNITFGSNIGDDLNFLVNVGQVGEKFSLRKAFDNITGDFIACLKGSFQTIGVSLIEKDLCLEHSSGRLSRCHVIAKGQIEQNPNRGTAFHMCQKFEGKWRRNFCHHRGTSDDLPQKFGLFSGSTCRARHGVVDQHFQRVIPVRIILILDLQNDLVKQRAIIDRLWCQPLFFAVFNLFGIGAVDAHDDSC